MDIIENVNRLEDYLINESEISLIDIQKISTYLTNIREEAINYTRCCTELKTVNEPLPYAEWKANLKMQKIEETIFKIGNDYKTMNDLLDMYGSYCNSF
tara:strand:+ start:6028 stop:6324 length:297 start_codon:yes stop_codon:yes gene_type:complete